MDFGAILPLTLTLAVLGIITSLFSSLLVIFMPKSIYIHYAILIILLVAAAVCFFFGYFKNDDTRKRGFLLVVGIICVIGGIVAGSISHEFHFNASLLNRASVYFIILLALHSAVSVWWSTLTSLWAFTNLNSSGLNQVDESILYVLVNSVVCFCTAFTISASQGSNSSIVNKSISYTIGIWIFSFLINGGIGWLIASKGGNGGASLSTVVDTVPTASADYEKVG